jgi:hypothetical protein
MDLGNKPRCWLAAAAAAVRLLLELRPSCLVLGLSRLLQLLLWLLRPLLPGTHCQLDQISSTALHTQRHKTQQEPC